MLKLKFSRFLCIMLLLPGLLLDMKVSKLILILFLLNPSPVFLASSVTKWKVDLLRLNFINTITTTIIESKLNEIDTLSNFTDFPFCL